ncbi:AEC family transporter [Microbacterium profundi]
MSILIQAILPVSALLVLGYLIKRFALPDVGSWKALEWLSYFVFAPAILATSIMETDLAGAPVLEMGSVLVIVSLGVVALILITGRFLRISRTRLSSMTQGGIRFNVFIGLTIASVGFGSTGVAVFAIAAAILAPFVNLVAVATLTVLNPDAAGFWAKRLVKEVFANPLIAGCAIGIALNLLNIDLPDALAVPVNLLAAPALACGTIVAGAGIVLTFDFKESLAVLFTVVVKLLVLPAAAVLLARTMGLHGLEVTMIALVCALPTGPGTYMLAMRMGGDAKLMASITGVQTLVSAATIPLILTLVQ